MKASEKNTLNNMDELCEIKDKKNNKIKKLIFNKNLK